MQVPDFIMIPTLLTREVWRRGARRLRSGPLYTWRFSGGLPSKIFLIPEDLRPADADFAPEFYAGRYSFRGFAPPEDHDHPFSIDPPTPEWFDDLHGFAWLRHLKIADTDLFRSHASSLVVDWIEAFGNQQNHPAWRSDIVARRLISWLVNIDLIIGNTAKENEETVLKALVSTSRYLQSNAQKMRPGYPTLQAIVAISYSSLCLAEREKNLKSAARDLDRCLERQILADGGHLSRNPAVLVELLADLLPLKSAYSTRGLPPSSTLIASIDKMQAALRFFRHGSGPIAQFNGTGATDYELLKALSRFDKTPASPQRSLPQSGYERLSADDTVVIMDTGKPKERAAAGHSMAGTLSFELSSGNHCFISNCGSPEILKDKYAPYARSTAAHSTATVAEASSSRFTSAGKWQSLLPSALISSPKNITVERQHEGEFDRIKANHDGYRPEFGITHHRELHLADDGATLNGIDRFEGMTDAPITLRFHLPVNVNASPLSSGHSILIAGPNNTGWTFTCVDAPIALEESIQFSGPGEPRKTTQIAVKLPSDTTVSDREVRWTFVKRVKKSKASKTDAPTADGALPDLLSKLD